jgi:hypothetical protein
MSILISDENVVQAITSLVQRAEREEDPQRLVRTYVDTGILSQLKNTNNQVLYGRRGTGKTHVFKVLEQHFSQENMTVTVYLDMRMLGSSALANDAERTTSARALGMYQDIMAEIHNFLLDTLIGGANSNTEKAFEELAKLANGVFEARYQGGPLTIDEFSETSAGRYGELTGGVSGVTVGLGSDRKEGRASRQTQTFDPLEKVYFPQVHRYLRDFLDSSRLAKLVIFLDEWSSCPGEVQPILAEFLKRTFLAEPRVVLKIAALEYRSIFYISRPGTSGYGLELGGDISTAMDLDSYFVYDQNPQALIGAYEELLFRHVIDRLPSHDYLRETYAVKDANQFRQAMFSESSFRELARAAEGVARDLINIFGQAYLNARRRGLDHIQVKEVEDAAETWYQQDKDRNLTPELRQTLQAIITDVIGHRKARSFMVGQELASHPRLQSLIDLRVVHLIHRGYADKENPGLRYNIFTLDYGTYVGLKRTVAAPEMDMQDIEHVEDPSERVVPFDDKRSIRRIILTAETLEGKSTPALGQR